MNPFSSLLLSKLNIDDDVRFSSNNTRYNKLYLPPLSHPESSQNLRKKDRKVYIIDYDDPISFIILHGKDITQHVCISSRYIFPSCFHSYLLSKLTKCRTRSSNRHRPPLITSRPENTKRQRPPDRFLPRLRYLDFLSYRHAIRNRRIVSSSGIHGLVVWRKYVA